MAVAIMYMCTRDGTLFKDRREANAHDKMLEAAELLQELIAASEVAGVDDELAEALAHYLVQQKDDTLRALKLVSSARTADTAVGAVPDAAAAFETDEAEEEGEAAEEEAEEEEYAEPPARSRKRSKRSKKKRA